MQCALSDACSQIASLGPRGDYFNPGSRKNAMERYGLTEEEFGSEQRS
jgi:hypothetical protein